MTFNRRFLVIGAIWAVLGVVALAGSAKLFWTSGPGRGEMIGQMLMLGFPGSNPDGKWAKTLARQIEDGKIGGVIFLGHNFKSPDQVKALTARFSGTDADLQPFLAVDMEGGKVQRLGAKLGYPAVPSAAFIGAGMTPETAKPHFETLARITREAGFNVNLAPVVDLSVSADNPVIVGLERSYGHTAVRVIGFAKAFIDAHRAQGIMTVLKHFPGHGSSLEDSHEGFVDISATWTNSELVPFNKLAKAGYADAIMPGHLVNEPLAGDNLPMSLSKGAIGGLLRSTMEYDGLVITDDLEMKAIRDNYSFEDVLVRAINAGVDVLMLTNGAKPDLNLADKAHKLISDAVDSGKIDPDLIRAAYGRIVKAKGAIAKGW